MQPPGHVPAHSRQYCCLGCGASRTAHPSLCLPQAAAGGSAACVSNVGTSDPAVSRHATQPQRAGRTVDHMLARPPSKGLPLSISTVVRGWLLMAVFQLCRQMQRGQVSGRVARPARMHMNAAARSERRWHNSLGPQGVQHAPSVRVRPRVGGCVAPQPHVACRGKEAALRVNGASRHQPADPMQWLLSTQPAARLTDEHVCVDLAGVDHIGVCARQRWQEGGSA